MYYMYVDNFQLFSDVIACVLKSGGVKARGPYIHYPWVSFSGGSELRSATCQFLQLLDVTIFFALPSSRPAQNYR